MRPESAISLVALPGSEEPRYPLRKFWARAFPLQGNEKKGRVARAARPQGLKSQRDKGRLAATAKSNPEVGERRRMDPVHGKHSGRRVGGEGTPTEERRRTTPGRMSGINSHTIVVIRPKQRI